MAKRDKPTTYYDARTRTGYADPFTHSAALIFFEQNDILHGKAPDHPEAPTRPLSAKQIKVRVRETYSALKATQWYNPLLDLDENGWDVTQSTPVEALHTYLLGPVKYLLRATKDALSAEDLDHFQVILESLSTEGLPCGSQLRAGYMLEHEKSLVGKELKLCAQLFPLAMATLRLGGRGTESLHLAWIALGRLGKAIYTREIPRSDLEVYLTELDAALVSFYDAYSQLLPFDVIYKPKLHMLSHLSDDIRSFGPASIFSSERFEADNTIIRNASILTNKSAPSLDILTRLDTASLLRFILQGGQLVAKNGKLQSSGDSVRNITMSPQQQTIIKPWGLKDAEGPSVGSTTKKSGAPTSQQTDDELGHEQCATIIAVDTATCKEGGFVLVRNDDGEIIFARVQTIWRPRFDSSSPEFIIASLFDDQGWDTKVGARSIRATKKTSARFSASDVLALINVQHDCYADKCRVDASGGRLRHEREPGTTTQPAIIHSKLQRFHVNGTLFRSAPLPPADFAEGDRDAISVFLARRIQQIRRRRARGEDGEESELSEVDYFSETEDVGEEHEDARSIQREMRRHEPESSDSSKDDSSQQ